MDFVSIDGANVVLAEKQDEYIAIVGRFDAATIAIHAATGEEYNAGPSVTVALKPTMEEALALLNGGTLHLRVLGGGFPPVALWVE